MGSMSRTAAYGLAGHRLDAQRDRVLAAWDGFLAVAEGTDLAGPSRLPGWTAHDVCVHVGDWPGVTTLDRVLESARTGDSEGAGDPARTDAANAAVVAAHRDATRAEVLAALARSRARIAQWFAAPDAADGPRALGLATAGSAVGPLPVLTVVAASAYELAVHALDLAPAKAPPPPSVLLDAGLAALVDVTGVFAHRRGVRASFAVVGRQGGWQLSTDEQGWTVAAVDRRPPGAAVEGDVATLLDASAGRRAVPALLVGRQIRVHGIPELARLAPIVEEVPGLPGGPALRAAARWFNGAGRLLRLGR